ncbi:HIRAN domain [Rhizoctonia solani]|uniref:HIRAN domain n=1 Tax=Rhizoctonia solani TaxID=456999 RepID=A0A8H7IE31_9AGAM|nr:HIRAN domain [Rhizoctonia solani]
MDSKVTLERLEKDLAEHRLEDNTTLGHSTNDLFFDIQDEELVENERQKQGNTSEDPLFRHRAPKTYRLLIVIILQMGTSIGCLRMKREAQRHDETAPPPKKQKPATSLPAISSRANSASASSLSLRSQSTKPPDYAALFVGDLTVEAWSTVKGKGHLRPGELLRLERDDLPGKTSNKSKANNIASITAAAKKKLGEDAIVRVVNSRGSEVGRIITASARWIAKLLDKDLVHLSGLPLDPPSEFKHTGDNFKILLKAYLKASAFRPLPMGSKPIMNKTLEKHLNANKKASLFFEGAETAEEQALRERKVGLVTLFNEVGLRPKRSGFSDFAGREGKKSSRTSGRAKSADAGDSRPSNKGDGGKKKLKTTETIGEGEEAEEAELEGEELNTNQAQRGDKQLAFMDPADSFALTLRPYQQQALCWMYNLERGEASARDSTSLHPLWEEYMFPFEEDDGVIDLCADERSFYFNPYSGELSLDFVRTENHKKGGILARGTPPTCSATADTVPAHTIISAFGKRKRPDKNNSQPTEPHATLLIAPISLLSQWQSELERSSHPDTLRTLVWHGLNRANLFEVLGPQPKGERPVDVVITSYGTLSSEYANVEKGKSSQIYDIQWMRVVLDEAHYCKSRHTKNAKACYKLNSVYRWALTASHGASMTSRCFLKYEPWSSFAYFKSFVTTPFLNRDPRAIEIIQVILENVLLRREKNMKDVDGNHIVELPPKVHRGAYVFPAERRTYEEIYIDAKKDFGDMDQSGTITKGFAICSIMRLRQAVLHPDLIKAPKEDPAEVDPLESDDGIENEPHPTPRPSVSLNKPDHGKSSFIVVDSHPVKEEFVEKETDYDQALSSQKNTMNKEGFRSSTKVDALLRNLNELREQDSSFRAIVFSQFTSFLDIIQKALVHHGFESMRLDGSMSQQQRSQALRSFTQPSEVPKIFCISLRAGGVGLNLTQAQYVFMMDFWWNRAAENQAIDRIHRIGQTRTVYVKHFVIQNTIEKRVLQIQKRKTAIVKGAFGQAGDKGTKESVQNMKLMFGD